MILEEYLNKPRVVKSEPDRLLKMEHKNKKHNIMILPIGSSIMDAIVYLYGDKSAQVIQGLVDGNKNLWGRIQMIRVGMEHNAICLKCLK